MAAAWAASRDNFMLEIWLDLRVTLERLSGPVNKSMAGSRAVLDHTKTWPKGPQCHGTIWRACLLCLQSRLRFLASAHSSEARMVLAFLSNISARLCEYKSDPSRVCQSHLLPSFCIISHLHPSPSCPPVITTHHPRPSSIITIRTITSPTITASRFSSMTTLSALVPVSMHQSLPPS